MGKIDWSKIKQKQSTEKPIGTKIGTLQQPEITTKGKINWNEVVSKRKKITTEIGKVREQFEGKLPLTKTGHIDTRYFYETPKWVLRYNKAVDEKVTKEFQKQPAGLLYRIMDVFNRLHPYEVMRDVVVEPEKYPTLLSKIGHYFETIKEPKVSPALRGYSELARGFSRRYAERYDPIAYIKYALGVAPEGYKREEYEKQVLEKGLPPSAFKFGENVIDIDRLLGLIGDIYADPTNIVLAGIGKLAKAPLFPFITKAKETVSETAMRGLTKTIVARTLKELPEEVGATQVLKSIIRKVGKENIDEAYTIFLNRFKEGWQSVAELTTKTEMPKGLSLIDYLMRKFSKVPYEAKVVRKLYKNFERGYADRLVQDFRSVFKGLGIAEDSLDAKVIDDYITMAWEYTGKKTAKLKTKLDEMAKTLTPIQKQGIDYCKKIANWEEFIETSSEFGLELEYGHTKNYLMSKYIDTGKEKAYFFPQLAQRLGITKPVFTHSKQFASMKEAVKKGFTPTTLFDKLETRLRLHAEAIQYRNFLNSVADMFGETSKKAGYRAVNITPKKFVKPLIGKYFPENLATYLERGNEVIKLGKFHEKLLNVIRPFTQTYKKIWTATSGFVIRNWYGSHLQNYIYGYPVLNPKTQALVKKLAWGTKNFDLTINGQKISADLFREIFDLSGISAGWFKGEVTELSKALGVFKGFRYASEMVERDARMFAMYSSLNKGDDLIKSFLTVKLLHFDYLDGLSQAEKVYLRTAIPFYSWYRFNTPLQLRFMIENPHRVANIYKIWRSLGIGTPEETPSWFNQYMMGKIGDVDLAKNTQRYLKLDIPLAQVGLLQTSFEALTEDPDMPPSQRFAKFVSPFITLTHPFFKSLFELTSNFDTFRTRPIYPKVVSPVPTFFIDAMPEFMKNWFGAEERKTKTGFRSYYLDGMKAKFLENLIPLYQLNVLSGYEKYEGYEEQKSKLDQLSLLGGVKLYPVNLDYIQGKYKRPIKKAPTKRIDWEKIVKERGKQ